MKVYIVVSNVLHLSQLIFKDKPYIVQLVKLLAVGRAHFEQIFQCCCLCCYILIIHVNIVQMRLCFKYSFCCTCKPL